MQKASLQNWMAETVFEDIFLIGKRLPGSSSSENVKSSSKSVIIFCSSALFTKH